MFYTPPWLIDHVLERTLAPALRDSGRNGDRLRSLRLCDPACGAGGFLIRAASRLAAAIEASGALSGGAARRHAVRSCVLGIDTDPIACALCRWILGAWSGVGHQELERTIVNLDALTAYPLSHDACACIVGNPPFLNQLRGRTASSGERIASLRALGLMGDEPYTDESGVFLLQALRRTRHGGRVGMVLPLSFLSAIGSSTIRDRLSSEGTIESLWVSRSHAFPGASVYTCVPVLRRSRSAEHDIERTVGVPPGPVSALRVGADTLRGWGNWSPIAAACFGIPEIRVSSRGTLGDHASAGADFRDEYYALKDRVIEDPGARIRLMTSGLVDPARDRWGRARARIHKKAWTHPALAHGAMDDPGVARWVMKRAVPKAIVATQTRVIETIADPEGVMAPVTPLISVVPSGARGVWSLAAAIGSPVASMVALRERIGSALHADAIKLSAAQVLALPAPVDADAWEEGARLFRAAQQAADDDWAMRIALFGSVMNDAYALGADEKRTLLEWWLGRLGLGSPDA